MDGIVDIKIGQSLPPCEWFAARDRLANALPALAEFIRLSNHAARGEENARLFMEDARMALVAIDYVGHFASDNCRYVILPNKGSSETPPNPAK